MYGWNGRMLRINLDSGDIINEEIDLDILKKYVGGRGLGIYYMLKEVPPETDPFGNENKLIMTTGPLTGTFAPTGARYMVTTKSPLTGALTCSNSGGRFPTELKKTGFDGIIIQGVSPEPVYIWINDDSVEIRSAKHIWGKTTHQADELLRAETKEKAKTAVIGPAGEKLVLFATIMNDKDRAAGRSGVGAIMGSKNLKGIVVRGNKTISVYNELLFKQICKKYRGKFKDANKINPSPLKKYGTAITALATQAHGVFPTHNFQYGTFEGWENISGEALTEKYLVKSKACFSCPIGCGRVTKIPDGPFKGEGEGPEYETIYSLGSSCGVDDLAAITKANYLCNELGLDTISMGSTIACAMELMEKGYLSKSDTGIELKWRDGSAVVELTKKTGYREGFGDLLAEGSLRLATKFGHPELAMVSKGQEFAGYDPRGAQAMGLAYATSPIGASHMRADSPYFELLGVPVKVDPQVWHNKPAIIVKWQDIFSLFDAAGLCVFFSIRYLVEPNLEIRPIPIMELLNAATGANYSLEELEKAGERIFNAERLFIVKAGFSRKDDNLPHRITDEPMPSGPAKGLVCHLNEMLDQYYRIREWSSDGIPSNKKVEELGII